VKIRPATEHDEPLLRELIEEFNTEIPEPDDVGPESWEDEWAAITRSLAGGAVYLAEDDQGAVGMAYAAPPDRGRSHLAVVHVRPRARRAGVAKALVLACVREVKERGAKRVSLDVLETNTRAREIWRRLGFEEVAHVMSAPVDALEGRLEAAPLGASRASTHVQSDDRTSVERALAQFVPRLEAADVHDAENGWIRISDSLLDADRDAQTRFARDLSDRLGAVVIALALEHGAVVRFRLFERGRMVDEYLSVPSFYGAMPKGDELALAANPTLVARLTGAEPDAVRRIARNASTTSELPPADELYAQIAQLMGLEL
jgi:ribosomal protein S18 acetylase RimI-like enzyme